MSNPNHEPAGTEKGGQFAHKEGDNGTVAAAAARQAAGLKSKGVEKVNATTKQAILLNNEWRKNYKQLEGPFWDTTDEKSPRYWIYRNDSGELVAGATTVQQGLRTDILSIGSHEQGAGVKILNELKDRNIWSVALASTPQSKKWFESQGFIRNENPGQWNYIWKKKIK